MKIFNWVQKRLHPKTLHDRFDSIDVHKPAMSEADTQALLKQAAVVDGIGGWGEGILAIGTFGFDTLKPFHPQQKYLNLESDMEDEAQTDGDGDCNDDGDRDVEQEELNPLMYAVSDDDENDDDPFMNAIAEVPCNEKKGERITLADLFLADSDEVKSKAMNPIQPVFDSSSELRLKKKRGLSFAKKMIPDESHPLKNLQQLMKRMLKRKIYPDFDLKNVKSDFDQCSSTKSGCSVKQKRQTSDSIDLLPCQGFSV